MSLSVRLQDVGHSDYQVTKQVSTSTVILHIVTVSLLDSDDKIMYK